MPDINGIPYVESGDLVSAYPTVSQDLAQEVSDQLATKLAAADQKIIQVISTTKTDAFTESVATGAVSGDVTGLTATITPTTNTNKVLVICHLTGTAGGTNPILPALYRAGSLINAATGDAAGSRSRVTSVGREAAGTIASTANFVYLDSPASTSALTYSIRLRHGGGGTNTVYVNRSETDTDAATTARTISTITLMEVGA